MTNKKLHLYIEQLKHNDKLKFVLLFETPCITENFHAAGLLIQAKKCN